MVLFFCLKRWNVPKWCFLNSFVLVVLFLFFRMDWAELLHHPFWTLLKGEDDAQDGDEKNKTAEKNGCEGVGMVNLRWVAVYFSEYERFTLILSLLLYLRMWQNICAQVNPNCTVNCNDLFTPKTNFNLRIKINEIISYAACLPLPPWIQKNAWPFSFRTCSQSNL